MTNFSHSKSMVGKVALFLFIASAISIFFYLDVQQYLTLESLKSHRNQLLAYTEMHYTTVALVFICLYCIQTALSLPGATILTLSAGLLFGSVLGALLVNIAATSGATIAFLTSRYLLHDWVERKFGHRLAPLQRGFSRNAFSYLLTLRLIPLFPFFLVNMVSGLTRIRPITYILATAAGIFPASFVYTNAGRQLGMIDSLGEIASPRVLGAFALLTIFALLPIAYRKFFSREVEDGVKQ